MGESDFDPEIIKKTQECLGKFVKKPPLTEKLLKRPPFKFIHDIVKVVINNSNVLEDLYTDDELNVENIKDRNDKLKFLQKLIDLLNSATSQKIDIKASKIVAGLEAEKTNELFQLLAFAIENKIDTKEAVKAVKRGGNLQNGTKTTKTRDESVEKKTEVKTKKEKIVANGKPSEPKKKVVSQNSIEKKSSTQNPVKKERSNSKTRIEPTKDSSKKSKNSTTKKSNLTTNGSLDSQNSLTNQQQPPSLPIEELNEEIIQKVETKPEEIVIENVTKVNEVVEAIPSNHQNENEKITEITTIPPAVKPQDELSAIIDEEAEFRRKEKATKKLSSKHRQKSVEEQPPPTSNEVNESPPKIEMNSAFKREERPKTSLRPPSARPASSRPAAPRRREKNIEIVLQPDETLKLGEITVKMENFTKELEDDGENLLIIEDPSVMDNFMNENIIATSNQMEMDDGDQGKLVQQILETEKNFEGALKIERSPQKLENDYDETKVQTNLKQIENLKELVQKLVRSVNPMGKLMDFVQEDIDSMQREYTKWSEIYKQSSTDLKKELSETANAIEPLKYQLNQLERQIEEHHQAIDELRGKLVLNEQKIFKIFSE